MSGSARRFRAPSADLVVLLVLLVLFGMAFVQARAWPFRTALFPTGTAIFVVAIILLKLLLDARSAGRARAVLAAPPILPLPPTVGGDAASAALIEEEAATEAEAEDVFSTTSRSVWLRSLAWLGGFFVLVWAAGLLVAIPIFAFAYLVVESRERRLTAAIYAVVSWVVIYGLFDQLLRIQLPSSAVLGLAGQ
ncbi:MAG: tripartite tricarboxylate transporter TctB family protein [Chloroflexi bacterium]|nr:tripartite tricarboxylate transporter TctB family protein [Chloroflexota bacterium]